jgi:hypothetical protein
MAFHFIQEKTQNARGFEAKLPTDGTLTWPGGKVDGEFGGSTSSVDSSPSDATLGGNIKCMKQGIAAQSAGCSIAVHFESAMRSLIDSVLLVSYRKTIII